MNKLIRTIIAAATALAFSTSAFAMIEEEGGTMPTGGSIGDLGSFGAEFANGGAEAIMGGDPRQGVTVIGSRCPAGSVASGTTATICLFGPFPSPIYSGYLSIDISGGGGGGPNGPQTPEEQAKCLNNCATANTVRTNACQIESDRLRHQLANRPYWAAIGGFVAGFIADKLGGGLAGAAFAYEGVNTSNDKVINDEYSGCMAGSAQMYNFCIHTTCHAYFALPLLLVPTVRRRRQQAGQ